MADLRFGLKLSQHAPIEDYRYAWRVADDAGFEHCWVMDHFATIGGAEDGDIFEAWTMQAAMAVATRRTRVGCMVTGNTYRHPGELAKMAVTVDHLSGGRLEFGIGAGWAELEHTMFGLELGRPGERLDRLEEACRIVRSLWTEPRTTFAGRYYTITDAVADTAEASGTFPECSTRTVQTSAAIRSRSGAPSRCGCSRPTTRASARSPITCTPAPTTSSSWRLRRAPGPAPTARPGCSAGCAT
jgi:alkanesulfonate monooxygenase SsuD/methylene tetrahydromethanopterin reductase-like flavin-dependent oxidoreductase (luciferase family)